MGPLAGACEGAATDVPRGAQGGAPNFEKVNHVYKRYVENGYNEGTPGTGRCV